MPSRVRGVVASQRAVVSAYDRMFSIANWEFAKNREKEISQKLNGKKIVTAYGVLKMESSYYEQDIVEKLKRGQCARKDKSAMRKCISSFIRKHRIPDIDLVLTGQIGGEQVYRLTFVELGVSDRYYYARKRVVKNSPAGIILDVLNGRRAGVINPIETDVVFDGSIAREYIRVMSSVGRFDVRNFLPKKSTMPRIELDKITHFLRPIPDLKKRVKGNVPVYFGYVFSDDVLLLMSFAEINLIGVVQSEEVISFGRKVRSKNIVVEARNMKPIEIVALERLFGVIVNVTDTKGDAKINSRKNSYKINWIAKVDWKNGKIRRKIEVNAKPKDIEEMYLLVKHAVERLK